MRCKHTCTEFLGSGFSTLNPFFIILVFSMAGSVPVCLLKFAGQTSL